MIGQRLRACVAALGLALGAPLAAQSELENAWALWRQAGSASYEYGYHKFCECYGDTPPETLVTVVDGEVTNVRHKRAESNSEVPAAEGNFRYYWTIEDLFALIESARENRAVVRARFDPMLGFPTSVYIDYVENIIGDEVDVRITRLTVR